MFYEFHLTIPPNTPVSLLASLQCDLDFGLITHVEVEFPTGCAGLAGVRVRERAHQLYPTNDGSFFVSNGYVIAFADDHRFFSPPFSLFLEGYNDDDTYPHTIGLRIGLTRPEDTTQSVFGSIFQNLAAPVVQTIHRLGGQVG